LAKVICPPRIHDHDTDGCRFDDPRQPLLALVQRRRRSPGFGEVHHDEPELLHRRRDPRFNPHEQRDVPGADQFQFAARHPVLAQNLLQKGVESRARRRGHVGLKWRASKCARSAPSKRAPA
jgi:hypothetical protein